MTVLPGPGNDIREMGTDGVSRVESANAARRLLHGRRARRHGGRAPVAPVRSGGIGRRSRDTRVGLLDPWDDPSEPRKRRRTARRIHGGLVEERGLFVFNKK